MLGLFLATTAASMPLHAMKAEKKVAASVERVDKEMSLLERIVAQANIVVDGADQQARIEAKKELTKLMKSKELDAKIKDAIKDDIKIIKNPRSKREMHEARIRLLNTYGEIDSQANVVEAIAQATKMVENASPEEFDAVLIEAKKMVEAAEEEQGFAARMYAKAKRIVTAPVNYVFGEESSKAKTAFYAAVGLAVLSAGAYVAYQYYGVYPNAEGAVQGLTFDVSKDDKENLKNAFINRFNVFLEIQDMPSDRKANMQSIIKNNANDVKILERELSSFMSKEAIEEIKNNVRSGQLEIPEIKRMPYLGVAAENNVPRQNTIDEIINDVYSIQKQRIPLQEEKNYWKTMHTLATEGKRPALSQAELNNEKKITDQLYSLYKQEDDLETSLWKSGLVKDADKATAMIKRAKYDYDVSKEAKSERNLYKQKYQLQLGDYYSDNYKTPESY